MAQEIEIDKKVFNEKFLTLLNRPERHIFVWGGAGSGKSYAVAQVLIVKIMQDRGRNILATRKTYSDIEQSLYNLFKQVVFSWDLSEHFKFQVRPLKITCLLNGNEIIFKGAADIEQVKSLTASNGPVTDVWLEEATEFTEKDYKQLSTRLRGGNLNKQLISTFNPVNKMHWIKSKSETKTNTFVLHSTCEDNKFIEEEYKQELRSYKEIDPYHYDVYYLGKWGTTGSSYFGANIVDRRLQALRKTPEFIQGTTITQEYKLHLYEEPTKEKQYIIGVDTAGAGEDYNEAVVVDINGHQVATLSVREDEALFVDKLEELGYKYNYAMIAAEINFSTYVSNELKRRGYANQYIRKKINKIKEKSTREYGFRTDKSTRPLMLMYLKKRFMKRQNFIKDIGTLEQMAIFIRDEDGRPAAELGGHDDKVMAMAIAMYILEEIAEKKVDLKVVKQVTKGEFDDILDGLEKEVIAEFFEIGEDVRIF